MHAGDDIVVDYQGAEHLGEYLQPFGGGWSLVRIRPDPLLDYGRIGRHFKNTDVDITVAVRNTRIQQVKGSTNG